MGKDWEWTRSRDERGANEAVENGFQTGAILVHAGGTHEQRFSSSPYKLVVVTPSILLSQQASAKVTERAEALGSATRTTVYTRSA